MFNEDEDWNDEEAAQVLSKTVVNANQTSKSSEHVKVDSIFKRNLLHVHISCLSLHVYLYYIYTIALFVCFFLIKGYR